MTEWARCGTWFLDCQAASANTGYRFVLTSTEDVKVRQAKQATDIKAELANLDKKLHYLETTYKNSQQHMEALFKRGG